MAGDYSDIGSFLSKWPLHRIGDFASVKGGKRLPLGTALVQGRTNHPYLRIVDFKDGRIDKSKLMYVPEDVFPRIARYTISSKDIYISIVGTIGLVGIVDEELDGANLTENAAKICNIASHIDKNYLAAFLRSGWGQHQIGALTVGSTQPKLALYRIEEIRVPVPPLPEQRAIAHILGTLDDKIELNRRMSETLERMAQALFKSWFVDFDPVVVNALRAGNPLPEKFAKRAAHYRENPDALGLPDPILRLFPARFVDSELGEIPEGWEVAIMGNQFRIVMGQSPPGSTYNESRKGSPFYQGRVDFSYRFPQQRVFCTAPTRFAQDGDTLVSVRAPVGSVNMAVERCAIGRGVAAVRYLTGSRSYTYYFVRSLKKIFENFEAEGTVFGAINKDGFNSIKCVVPPIRLVERFDALCKPLDDKIERNERESRTLAALRDTLLPRLISGQLRVKDAERFLKERGL